MPVNRRTSEEGPTQMVCQSLTWMFCDAHPVALLLNVACPIFKKNLNFRPLDLTRLRFSARNPAQPMLSSALSSANMEF